jgi:hypothetical protein
MADKKRRFDKRDFNQMAEVITQDKRDRAGRRSDKEAIWKEIDRQIAMTPDCSFKMSGGRAIESKAWWPEIELPWQSQALEVLNADSRRMMFPDSGPWYQASVFMTDEYLARADFRSIVAGDSNEVPSQLDQDNANKLVEGFGRHFRKQYDFRGHWDELNAEAFKYGTFAGRARLVEKKAFIDTAKGVVPENHKIPMLVPKCIKNLYPDDRKHRMLNEGIMVAGSVIDCWWQALKDLEMAARKGSQDPKNALGGWMPSALKGIEPDKNGQVEVLEYEGDIILPRKTTRSMFLPNVVVTVIVSSGGASVVRFRTGMRRSYIIHSYDSEDVTTPYGSGPLMKGRPIQKSAVHSLTLYQAAGELDVERPVIYSEDDPYFASTGGPVIAPGEQWKTSQGVSTAQLGDGSSQFQSYLAFQQQYADVTGVNAPRLGAQTVSHTTAFAKNAEMQRGQSRTVDYVRSVLQHPMEKWLHMEFELGKAAIKDTLSFYIPAYQGAVTIDKDMLPDQVEFEVYGAGGPGEESAKVQKQQAALQSALQLEEFKLQTNPEATPLDIEAMQKQILGEAFAESDTFFARPPEDVSMGVAADPGVSSPIEGIPGAELAILEG